MKIPLLLCTIMLFFTSMISAQEKLISDRPLPIMAWAGIPETETNLERFKELKDMGINVNLSNYPSADAMQKALDLAQQTGLKMVTSCPELKSDPETIVKRFMNHPALAGYFLRDEPVRKDFAELAAWAKKIEAFDKMHFCFVNLISISTPRNQKLLERLHMLNMSPHSQMKFHHSSSLSIFTPSLPKVFTKAGTPVLKCFLQKQRS